nr:putative neuroblastoma breakpoint family member 5 isoform X1 [Microcebus murinus]
MDVRDNTRELRSRLAEAKQQIRDLREKLNISESTAFFPANRLQKYTHPDTIFIWERLLRSSHSQHEGTASPVVLGASQLCRSHCVTPKQRFTSQTARLGHVTPDQSQTLRDVNSTLSNPSSIFVK